MAKRVIGIVGAIGSGKSLVSAELVKQGGCVIAADDFGHEALRQPALIDQVRKRWGDGVLNDDGSVNRRKLGGRVFANDGDRNELERIVFPFIERRIDEERDRAERDPRFRMIVFDAAIMLEAGWNRICHWLAYVHCPRPLRLRRLAQGRGLSVSEIEARENAQWPLLRKLLAADDLIDNSGTPEQTHVQVRKMLGFLARGA